MTTDELEVEVKFLVDDLDALHRRLDEVGAQLIGPRVHEKNVRYDTVDGALLRRSQLLRLRRDTRDRLTFKGLAAEDAASEAKVREEIELEIGDFDQMAKILGRLGFQPVQTYEKYRETYQWRGVEILLDEMPFGSFVELEGAESGLKATAAILGLDWAKRLLTNYLELMEQCRQTFALPFTDLTFANFERRPVDLAELLPICTLSDG